MSLAKQFLDAAIVDDKGALALDPEKLAAATAAYDAALQAGDVAAVTQELLSVAFFFELKKGARDVAQQIVEVARRAVPLLARAGVAFDDVAAQTERKSAALLGQTQSKIPVGQSGTPGAKWWQVR